MTLSTHDTPLSQDEVLQRIGEVRERLGEDVYILVHHYERDEVVRFADVVGDSLELSREAAAQGRARYIVFCGVDFMAETAAMLCGAQQTVLIPEPTAHCPMAAMVNADEAALAYGRLSSLWGGDLLPITYQNSDAQVKALCGRHGGAVCTSANAGTLFRWALGQRGHLLFFPDEHLGTNTALAMGLPQQEIALWNPREPEASSERAAGARVVVWQGYCHVHTRFTVSDVQRVRREHPSARVIVHPECPAPVVQAADGAGSTGYIVREAVEAPAGSTLAIGTEINLVARLARRHADKTIIPLARSLCGTMYRIDERKLLRTLESIEAGRPEYVVTVDAETTRWANEALQRMLSVG
ncbi:MAG TPA: quinolinate synthase NadA [Anaerolineae bacterium]|nr:quinolinate synthase NadA [Anaerolineae bacterium]HPL29583.1 quinolinate synthase NadA [Anaerolineae bacterium]